MKATIHIQNLRCSGCKVNIINSLSAIKHISGVEVNMDDETIIFDYDTYQAFIKAKHVLSAIGHPIRGSENKLYTKSSLI